MKKKIALLFLSLTALTSCTGNDDNPVEAENFNSTAVLDSEAFNPDNGTYYEGTPDSHRHINFSMSQRIWGTNNPGMIIDLYVPFGQQSLSGDYNMGIGEATDALAAVYLNMNGDSYTISSSEYLKVTDLGNSRFRFEFIDGYGTIFSGPTVPFEGVIEGTFTFVEQE